MLLYLFDLILLFTLLFSLFFFSVEEGTQTTSSGSVSPVAVAVPVVIVLLIILSDKSYYILSYTYQDLLCEIQFNKISFANNSWPIELSASFFFTCDENRSISNEGKLAVVVWLNFEFDCTNRGSKHEWKQICSDYINGLDNKNTIQIKLTDSFALTGLKTLGKDVVYLYLVPLTESSFQRYLPRFF